MRGCRLGGTQDYCCNDAQIWNSSGCFASVSADYFPHRLSALRAISFSSAGQAKRTASPLTPALSPLRGEGARRVILEYRRSSPAFGEYVSERCPNAARPCEPPSASAGTPSPLNGERAGVRGEDTRDLPA